MSTTFKAYLQAQGKSKHTVSRYLDFILDFLAWLDRDNTEAEHATAKEVLAYLKYLQQRGLQTQTRRVRLGVIKHFFNYQIECGQRTEHPIKHLKLRGADTQKLYPILDQSQLQALYDAYLVPGEDHPKAHCNWFTVFQLSKQRNKAIVSLLVNQGVTTTEITRLQVNDLQLKAGKIYIGSCRKSNERTLELKAHQIIELMEYQYTTRTQLLHYQKHPTQQLFLSAPLVSESYAKPTLQIWKPLTKALQQQHPAFINIPQIRTSVITHWLNQYNLRQVQYLAGHKYISSTERYLVNQIEDLQADIDHFHPMT